jgi:formylglycine-generating enzyme required for sulfatase activity
MTPHATVVSKDRASAWDARPGRMVWIEGGKLRMGSDRRYPEEALAHRVRVDGFWIDRTPVTNHQFREFVAAMGYVTVAEIAPDPKDYADALRPIAAATIARPHATPSRWTRRRATWIPIRRQARQHLMSIGNDYARGRE